MAKYIFVTTNCDECGSIFSSICKAGDYSGKCMDCQEKAEAPVVNPEHVAADLDQIEVRSTGAANRKPRPFFCDRVCLHEFDLSFVQHHVGLDIKVCECGWHRDWTNEVHTRPYTTPQKPWRR